MLTAATLRKQPKCPQKTRGKQRRSTHTKEYYLIIKRKKILPFETAWRELESIMLSEISQSERDQYHIISLCEI